MIVYLLVMTGVAEIAFLFVDERLAIACAWAALVSVTVGAGVTIGRRRECWSCGRRVEARNRLGLCRRCLGVREHPARGITVR